MGLEINVIKDSDSFTGDKLEIKKGDQIFMVLIVALRGMRDCSGIEAAADMALIARHQLEMPMVNNLEGSVKGWGRLGGPRRQRLTPFEYRQLLEVFRSYKKKEKQDAD